MPLLFLDLGKPQLLLLQPFELVDALLHDGDAERGREFRVVLRARQHAGRARIGHAHRRQAVAELELQPDVDVDLAQRQFGHGLHLDVGIGVLAGDGIEAHLPLGHRDAARDRAESSARATAQLIEGAR